MLSILIPTYNQPCLALVEELQRQAEGLAIAYEILLVDDGSTDAETLRQNKLIARIPTCRCLPTRKNIGPARIRNYLADMAEYPYLLFLDADTYPASPHFLSAYWKARGMNRVVCGGFAYERTDTPAMCALRYQYGIHVEEKSAKARNRSPYEQFISMSFLADKYIFKRVRFAETMHFGYEDTYWGMMLEQAHVELVHIDNPVFHRTQDSAEAYLDKVRRSVKNLAENRELMRSQVRLLRWHEKISDFGLDGIFVYFFKKMRNKLERNLKGESPSMYLFAFYKLGYLCVVLRESKPDCT